MYYYLTSTASWQKGQTIFLKTILGVYHWINWNQSLNAPTVFWYYFTVVWQTLKKMVSDCIEKSLSWICLNRRKKCGISMKITVPQVAQRLAKACVAQSILCCYFGRATARKLKLWQNILPLRSFVIKTKGGVQFGKKLIFQGGGVGTGRVFYS